MEDYPATLAEFEERFATEQACREYLSRRRWPKGFVCPRCGSGKSWLTRRGLWVCPGCGYQASPMAGTVFQDTHKPLMVWFRAMWWVSSQKTGASALGLQKALGLGSYQTAWAWLHKLRRAMVRPGRDRLSGRVEVDETYVGGLEEGRPGRPGRRDGKKAMVVIAAEEDGRGIGRIRMRRVPDGSGEHLHAFIQDVVEPGSCLHTDWWSGYQGIERKGYRHDRDKQKDDANLLPRIHRVASLLKRWLLGTHQGAVSPEHLEYYLDEFTFRFNRRTSRYRGKLFFRLVEQAAMVDPVPYRRLVKHVRGPPPSDPIPSG